MTRIDFNREAQLCQQSDAISKLRLGFNIGAYSVPMYCLRFLKAIRVSFIIESTGQCPKSFFVTM